MFTKILIANRGEIACRVIKTARKMGIQTVAVYRRPTATRATSNSPTRPSSSAPRPAASYLVADKIIAACKQTGAQAVHRATASCRRTRSSRKRVEEEGIVFIGPKHASIAAMGDKIASKEAGRCGQGQHHPGLQRRHRVARAGGDDRQGHRLPGDDQGQRRRRRQGCAWPSTTSRRPSRGFSSCRNEAKNSFGDDRVFIEKFVEEPRHIEIQVLGDAHGNVVYLHERECSIQRRHQKVIEEAPSPFISEATRKAMGEQAVALAKAVNYQSAGTVEFVVGRDQSFYFLEMNTRLQVEHPVTECITGLDLVEQMIRVAAGEKLRFTQAQIRAGWAMECRINAGRPVPATSCPPPAGW